MKPQARLEKEDENQNQVYPRRAGPFQGGGSEQAETTVTLLHSTSHGTALQMQWNFQL